MKRRNKNHKIIKYKRAFDNDLRYSINVDTSLEYLLSSGVIPKEIGSYNDNLEEDYSYVSLTDISERQRYHENNIKDKSDYLDDVTYFDEDLEQDYEDVKVFKGKNKSNKVKNNK